MNQVIFFQSLNRGNLLSLKKKIKSGGRVGKIEDNLIIEEYAGECQECQRETKEKVCPICKI